MSNLHTEIEALKERVARLESARTNRGRTNQAGAARYLGKSREWLRLRHLRGDGPRRGADGSYSFDDLDAFSESEAVTA
jgi:hypothetical protein